ncbi:hypothetical protein GmRootA79_53370 (plasmid) [Acidovorax sp. A79]|uniref:hypothetical protein n=1 Tax=Acidovorax sp. A79 TaxID=3056107 RepID=UPI0034E8ABCB
MNLSNLLNQLMAEYGSGMNDMQVIFIADENGHPATGIDGALFLLWSCSRGLLEEELSVRLSNSHLRVDASFADMVRDARSFFGEGVRPSHFNERGRSFALKYLRPGWEYRYHLDLDDLFPDEATYADIPESQASIDKVFAILDARRKHFGAWLR